jgi:hypothetical protein
LESAVHLGPQVRRTQFAARTHLGRRTVGGGLTDGTTPRNAAELDVFEGVGQPDRTSDGSVAGVLSATFNTPASAGNLWQ